MFEHCEFSDDSYVINAKYTQAEALQIFEENSDTYNSFRNRKLCRKAKIEDVHKMQCRYYIKPSELADHVPADKETGYYLLCGGKTSFPVWVIDPWAIMENTERFSDLSDLHAYKINKEFWISHLNIDDTFSYIIEYTNTIPNTIYCIENMKEYDKNSIVAVEAYKQDQEFIKMLQDFYKSGHEALNGEKHRGFVYKNRWLKNTTLYNAIAMRGYSGTPYRLYSFD